MHNNQDNNLTSENNLIYDYWNSDLYFAIQLHL